EVLGQRQRDRSGSQSGENQSANRRGGQLGIRLRFDQRMLAVRTAQVSFQAWIATRRAEHATALGLTIGQIGAAATVARNSAPVKRRGHNFHPPFLLFPFPCSTFAIKVDASSQLSRPSPSSRLGGHPCNAPLFRTERSWTDIPCAPTRRHPAGA